MFAVPGFSGPTLGGFNSIDVCVCVGWSHDHSREQWELALFGFHSPLAGFKFQALFKEDGAEGQVTIEKCSGGKNRRL